MMVGPAAVGPVVLRGSGAGRPAAARPGLCSGGELGALTAPGASACGAGSLSPSLCTSASMISVSTWLWYCSRPDVLSVDCTFPHLQALRCAAAAPIASRVPKKLLYVCASASLHRQHCSNPDLKRAQPTAEFPHVPALPCAAAAPVASGVFSPAAGSPPEQGFMGTPLSGQAASSSSTDPGFADRSNTLPTTGGGSGEGRGKSRLSSVQGGRGSDAAEVGHIAACGMPCRAQCDTTPCCASEGLKPPQAAGSWGLAR